jgi:hypothetical protein
VGEALFGKDLEISETGGSSFIVSPGGSYCVRRKRYVAAIDGHWKKITTAKEASGRKTML